MITTEDRLWFAFVLWESDIYNNCTGLSNQDHLVVICFRSLRIWYLQQLAGRGKMSGKSCDLLSFFENLIFTTTIVRYWYARNWLWFAFVLWESDIYNNGKNRNNSQPPVVICFRSLRIWYLQQPRYKEDMALIGCDLLSFFENLIFTTTLHILILCPW